ncbi:hypothetical protein Mapa_012238 [Marchantia paleacea]|nr:hypothetical protein Mapa_012238 [Marchantia paleacea]
MLRVVDVILPSHVRLDPSGGHQRRAWRRRCLLARPVGVQSRLRKVGMKFLRQKEKLVRGG